MSHPTENTGSHGVLAELVAHRAEIAALIADENTAQLISKVKDFIAHPSWATFPAAQALHVGGAIAAAVAEAAKPSVEAAKPTIEAAKPIIEAAKPTIEAAEPTHLIEKTDEKQSAEPRLYDVMTDAERRGHPLAYGTGEFGTVTLLDVMPRLIPVGSLGVESAIVDAARVSYAKGTRPVRDDVALLRYLARHEHWGPFEFVVLKFRISCPIFVARQWFRHRTGSYNEESARYSEVADEFYVPAAGEVRAQSTTNKQGSSAEGGVARDKQEEFAQGAEATTKFAYNTYRLALAAGVAREQARAILPQGAYTRFVFKMDLRNLYGFLRLRMDAHAQKEIRDFAEAIHSIVAGVAPHAMAIFDDYMRGAVTLTALEVRALQSGANPPEMSASEAREWEAKKKKLQK